MVWLAFAWSRPAFPADAPAPASPAPASPAPASDDATVDNQPVDVVTFLGTDAAAPVADAPAGKPVSTLRLAPIAIGFEGNVGYDIEQHSSEGSDATLQQQLTLRLDGYASSYFWQPWMAKVKGHLGLIASKRKLNDSGSSNNTILGNTGIYLVPYSRFPFEASISRNQNYSGAGIGSLFSQTTRFDMRQRYTPRHRKEAYQVSYNRSLSDRGGLDTDRQTGLGFLMRSVRFKQQEFEAEASSTRGRRSYNGQNTLENRAEVKHEYRPGDGLSLENNALLKSSSEQTALASTSFRNRELSSILIKLLRPAKADYSVIGSARAHVSDNSNQVTSSRTRVVNASLGGTYTPSQYITMSASGNVNVTNSVLTYSLSMGSSQSVSANYPMAAVNLGDWRYTPRLTGSISNSTNNNDGRTGSVQTASISPGHSLSRGMDFGGGKLGLGLSESLSLSESTRSRASSSLSHSGSANWRRTQGKSNTSLRLDGSDSRSLSRTQDSFQRISLNAGISETFSRDSSLSGNLSVHATRQVTMAAPDANIATSSSASLHYNHQRAFNVPRLTFSSTVKVISRALIPVLAATPEDQGPVTWENTLIYHVGRLEAKFKVNLSKSGDGATQSLIGLYLQRYF